MLIINEQFVSRRDLFVTPIIGGATVWKEVKSIKEYRLAIVKNMAKFKSNGQYICDNCSETFTRALSLYRHVTHECASTVFERIHRCPYCMFQAGYNYSIMSHMATKHYELMALRN